MNVVSINQRMVNDSAVDMLKKILADTEAGKVAGIAVVAVLSDGCVLDGWSAGDFNKYTMVGGIEAMKRDYLNLEIEQR